MFEQSVVEARTLTARPWTLGVSVLGQGVLITAAVVLPMLHPETMQRVVMLVPIGGPPAPYHRQEPQPAGTPRSVPSSPRAFKCTFCAPTRIPPTISTLPDEPGPAVAAEGPSGPPGGVVGGIWIAGAGGIGRVPEIPPPTKPKPTPRVEQPVLKPAQAAPAAPTKVGGDVQASMLIHKPEPIYPTLARQARIQGVVHLTALISTEGRITSLRALDGHPLLVRAAIDAVKQWVYRPTLLNGVPVEVITEITVTFSLN